MLLGLLDRHHCFKSGTIPEPVGGNIHLNDVKAFDLRKLKQTQKEDLLEQKYFTGSTQLLTPNHSFKACGSPEVLTTISKK